MQNQKLVEIDAATFQPQLLSLAETLALKVDREGVSIFAVPSYVHQDLFVLLRYAKHAFGFLSYLNADERRSEDIYWREQHSILGLTAVRKIIDCLYTITRILGDLAKHGRQYRMSGLKKFMLNLEEEERKYKDRPEWEPHFEMRRQLLERVMAEVGVQSEEVATAKTLKTLGAHLREVYGKENEMETFLRSLTLGSWSDYSALAHASFEGIIPHGLYFIQDVLPHDMRPIVAENWPRFISMHLSRAAGVLLCILTEVQAKYQFDKEGTARINERLREIWNALLLRMR